MPPRCFNRYPEGARVRFQLGGIGRGTHPRHYPSTSDRPLGHALGHKATCPRHSITTSARVSMVGAIASPSSFAVVRFTTSVNRVGRSNDKIRIGRVMLHIGESSIEVMRFTYR